MTVKLLTKHHLECLSLHLSNCHVVGNLMSWLNYVLCLFQDVSAKKRKMATVKNAFLLLSCQYLCPENVSRGNIMPATYNQMHLGKQIQTSL